MPDISLATNLDRFVRKIHVRLHARAKEFDKDKVGPGGAILLLTLEENGTLTLGELSRIMIRDKSQITREIASLIRKGMVAKTESKKDSRVSLVTLTDKGRNLVAKHHQELSEVLGELLGGLSPDEVRELSMLLAKAEPATRT